MTALLTGKQGDHELRYALLAVTDRRNPNFKPDRYGSAHQNARGRRQCSDSTQCRTLCTASNGRTRWHRTIGWFGLALGIAVFGLGVSSTIVMHRFEFLTLHQGQNAIVYSSIPLWDMLCFAVVFSLAILWRKKLEYHRRLMLIASCVLTAAAWGRLPESVLPGLWFYAGVDLLILMGAARDLLVNRKIHRVYLIVLPLLISGQIVIAQITFTESWKRLAHAILF
jgi:hypothetical protein